MKRADLEFAVRHLTPPGTELFERDGAVTSINTDQDGYRFRLLPKRTALVGHGFVDGVSIHRLVAEDTQALVEVVDKALREASKEIAAKMRALADQLDPPGAAT